MTNRNAMLLGSLGGNATKEKYGSEHYAKLSKKGHKVIIAKYGKDYYKNIARKRWDKYKAEKLSTGTLDSIIE